MLVTARAYPVLDGIAIEVSVIEDGEPGGHRFARNIISLVVYAPPWELDAVAVTQSLSTAMQEWAWTQRGV